MQYDDETLVAYADGELDDAASLELEGAIAGDPALRARLQALVSVSALTERAFAAPMNEPVPDRLANLVVMKPTGRRRPGVPIRRSWPMALAACLALLAGLGLGRWSALPGIGEPGAGDLAGAPPAAVATALTALPDYAGETIADEELSLLDSFEDAAGRFCRVYTLADADGGVEAVACHGGTGGAEGWRLAVSVPLLPPPAPDAVRPAAGPQALVDAALAVLGAGAPLSAEEVTARQAALSP